MGLKLMQLKNKRLTHNAIFKYTVSMKCDSVNRYPAPVPQKLHGIIRENGKKIKDDKYLL